jgi:hypothetical protein
MKIRFYIVTYKNPTVLNDWILASLYNSEYDRENVEIYIINNHSQFFIEDKYKPMVTVLHNTLRPDFSTGHLARNHNHAIINGFETLQPGHEKCDAVISCQNDTKVLPNWEETVKTLLKTYTYASFGTGDQFQIFTPEGIRTTGIYDERFCNIGYQEADYFLRSYIYNRDKSSINDHAHARLWNTSDLCPIENTVAGWWREGESRDIHGASYHFHEYSRTVFIRKWGIPSEGWIIDELDKAPNPSLIPNFVTYPYFEQYVDKLREKNYVYGPA